MNNYPFVLLASKSPRRKQLLEQLGFDFEVITQDVEEVFPDNLDKNKVPEFLARLKANAIDYPLQNQQVILASDTIVLQGDTIFHKPKDKKDAQRILRALSDSIHEVITGVCLKSKTKTVCFSDVAKVYFAPLTTAEIDFYIDNCQPYDKAGAYAIQEWIGLAKVKKIEGTYNTIVGLPTQKVYQAIIDNFC